MSHFPVLRAEALEYLAIRPDGTYLDVTAGLGGHTGEIARRLNTGKVIASDRDAESLAIARQNTLDVTARIQFIHATFSTLADVLAEVGYGKVDGLLADLGVSRFQLTEAPRGFSFMTDGPLDMRMDQSRGVSASVLVFFI